jgi:hypothetical protein
LLAVVEVAAEHLEAMAAAGQADIFQQLLLVSLPEKL